MEGAADQKDGEGRLELHSANSSHLALMGGRWLYRSHFDRLGIETSSAEFLATLGFWVMLPWALKMPLGHLVDILWRYKSGLIYLGAALIAASLMIMTNLLADLDYMRQVMPAENWFILASLLAPVGYVMQDIVADAMTVEAVVRFDKEGKHVPQAQIRLAHTTMQTLGRVAIICGTLIDAAANVYWFSGVDKMNVAAKAEVYLTIYHLPLGLVDSSCFNPWCVAVVLAAFASAEKHGNGALAE